MSESIAQALGRCSDRTHRLRRSAARGGEILVQGAGCVLGSWRLLHLHGAYTIAFDLCLNNRTPLPPPPSPKNTNTISEMDTHEYETAPCGAIVMKVPNLLAMVGPSLPTPLRLLRTPSSLLFCHFAPRLPSPQCSLADVRLTSK